MHVGGSNRSLGITNPHHISDGISVTQLSSFTIAKPNPTSLKPAPAHTKACDPQRVYLRIRMRGVCYEAFTVTFFRSMLSSYLSWSVGPRSPSVWPMKAFQQPTDLIQVMEIKGISIPHTQASTQFKHTGQPDTIHLTKNTHSIYTLRQFAVNPNF